MKPTHYLKNKTIVVELSKNYVFQLCWKYFTEELPKTPEFSSASFCVVDGSKFENLDSLGMGSEIFLMGQKFIENGGKEFVLSGFSKEQLAILRLLAIDKNSFPRHFSSIKSAANFFDK